MICCEAPDDATTEDLGEEHKLVGHVKEMVATDVRGGLFPYVHKYQEWDRPVYSHRRKVCHKWYRDGEEYAMWHYDFNHESCL